MQKFNRIITLLGVLALVFSITACNSEEKQTTPTETQPVVEKAVEEKASPYPFPEKENYEIVLTAYKDSAKIQIIKLVREANGMLLKDAKKNVETLPFAVKKDVPNKEAKEIYQKFIDAGATLEMK